MIRNIPYNLYYELAIIPVDVVILIFVLKSYKDDTEANFRFKIFSSFVAISTTLDVLTSMIHSMGNDLPLWFRVTFNAIDCFIAFFTALSFSIYMSAFSGETKEGRGRFRKTLNAIVNVSYTSILLINFFVPIVFTFDAEGKYVHGPLYFLIAFLFPLFYAVEGVFIAVMNKKRFTRIQLFALRGALLITIFFFCLQIFIIPQTMLTFYTASLAMIILFLVLETPDYTKLKDALNNLEKAKENEKRAKDKLKIAIEVKAKFLTYLSHEMKTPVNSILGFSEQILNSKDADNITKKNAERIYGSAQRINHFFSTAIDNAITHNNYDDENEIVFESDGYEIMAHQPGGMASGKMPPDIAGPVRMGPPEGFGAPEGFGPPAGVGVGVFGAPGVLSDEEETDGRSSVVSTTQVHGDTYHRFGYKRDSAQYRILCVDDNELNMELLIKILKNFGFNTDSAVNGLEAIDLVRKNSYDLIMMDHMMPGMDGIDAMHIIRNEGLCDLTPIIVVTANAVKGEKEKYLREGFDSYIPKPFSGGSVLRVVGKFLPVAMMDTLVRYNDSVGISRFMLASTFSRPVIAPGSRILVAGNDREATGRIARLLLTTLARIEIVYDGDECINLLSTKEYDIIFVEDGLKTSSGRFVKGYIWNNINSPSIAMFSSVSAEDSAIIYESYTDYIDFNCESDILDAMLLLYLPKDKVYVVGSGRYEDANEELFESTSPKSDIYSQINDITGPNASKVTEPEIDPFAVIDDYEIPEYVYNIQGINVDNGISNCGSGESFVRALDIFASSAKNKAVDIRKFYDGKDIESYTIQVHALKSSARIIGASELSDMAFALEQAGNEKNTELIEEKTDELIEKYLKIASDIEAGNKPEESSDKTPADEATLKDAYSSIYELGSMMDYDSIEMILGQLDNYSFDSVNEARVNKIKEGLNELNWEKVVQTAKEAL